MVQYIFDNSKNEIWFCLWEWFIRGKHWKYSPTHSCPLLICKILNGGDWSGYDWSDLTYLKPRWLCTGCLSIYFMENILACGEFFSIHVIYAGNSNGPFIRMPKTYFLLFSFFFFSVDDIMIWIEPQAPTRALLDFTHKQFSFVLFCAIFFWINRLGNILSVT